MSGINFDIKIDGLDLALERMNNVADLEISQLLENVGSMVESQTRDRLDDTKTAPDGTPWADWSPSYKKTRHSGQSLLVSGKGTRKNPSEDLANSIEYLVDGDAVIVGSPVPYAAYPQFGSEKMNNPARPYLGISDDNKIEIIEKVNEFVNEVLS